MRFAGPDAVLFLVGLLLFGGASAAIVTSPGGLDALTGGAASALGVYDVTYATSVVEGETQDVASFSSAEVTFDVNNTDVSKVVLVVACSDAAPGPAAAQLTVTVSHPNVTAEPQSFACSDQELSFDVAPVPGPTTVQGGTPDEARDNLPQSGNATKATGTWTVTVTATRGGQNLPLPGPGAIPGGSLTLNVEKWAPTLTPVPK